MWYFIGDVCDNECMKIVMKEVDYVVYVVVFKQVFVVEYNFNECIKININGVQNVIDVVMVNNVVWVIVLLIDKVVNLVNFYGVIKLVFDKLFVVVNNILGVIGLCFFVVCYGNVVGFCGFVVFFFC